MLVLGSSRMIGFLAGKLDVTLITAGCRAVAAADAAAVMTLAELGWCEGCVGEGVGRS
jgi:hypothetical protein